MSDEFQKFINNLYQVQSKNNNTNLKKNYDI